MEDELRGIMDIGFSIHFTLAGQLHRSDVQMKQDIATVKSVLDSWRPSRPGMHIIDNKVKEFLVHVLRECDEYKGTSRKVSRDGHTTDPYEKYLRNHSY